MAMMISIPEKIKIDNAPVIADCARRFSVPKKKVKPMTTTFNSAQKYYLYLRELAATAYGFETTDLLTNC
jgi:hypothetical protein